MLHIADTKLARRYGEFFVRQIHKLEEVRFLAFVTLHMFLICFFHSLFYSSVHQSENSTNFMIFIWFFILNNEIIQ